MYMCIAHNLYCLAQISGCSSQRSTRRWRHTPTERCTPLASRGSRLNGRAEVRLLMRLRLLPVQPVPEEGGRWQQQCQQSHRDERERESFYDYEVSKWCLNFNDLGPILQNVFYRNPSAIKYGLIQKAFGQIRGLFHEAIWIHSYGLVIIANFDHNFPLKLGKIHNFVCQFME